MHFKGVYKVSKYNLSTAEIIKKSIQGKSINS